jgi:hypothetical protein
MRSTGIACLCTKLYCTLLYSTQILEGKELLNERTDAEYKYLKKVCVVLFMSIKYRPCLEYVGICDFSFLVSRYVTQVLWALSTS